jgi:DNA modification methylase
MIQWTEKTVPVSALKPYERNPRTISKGARDKLKSSIVDLGYHQRCIVQPDMRLIGGHQRLDIFKELGITEISVLIPHRQLTPEEYRRLLITDNLPFGDFNFEMLGADFKLDELKAWGMSDEWIKKIPIKFDDEKAEETPPLRDKVTSAPGDIWLLGGHRVMCGSSTSAPDVSRLLNGAKPHLMVTDPPYGVEYDPSWREKVDGGKGKRNNGLVLNDHIADWREAWALFPGDVAYVWHSGIHAREVQESLEACEFKIYTQIIWAKQQLQMSRGHYHWKHESCFYAVRKGGTGHWQGDRKQHTLWEINNNNPVGGNEREEQTGHGTQKPIECMRRPILNNSEKGDLVYEPFAGSGSTLIAAEQAERVCFAMELAPNYVDLICRR